MKSIDEPSESPPPRPQAAAVQVLLVDDHPVFRQGLRQMLRNETGFSVCGEASGASQALELFREFQPGIVVLDVSLPGVNGIELLKMFRAERPEAKVLVLSMHEESLYGVRALKAGARGFLSKSEVSDSVVEALHRIVEGKLYVSPELGERLVCKAIQALDSGLDSPVDALSDREVEVLEKIGHGFGTREIADELRVSPKTVETHRAHIREKLDLRDATALVRFALDWVAHRETRPAAGSVGAPAVG